MEKNTQVTENVALQEEQPTITWKDVKALKSTKYHENMAKYKKSFILRNNKTGAIVELRGISPFHACKFIKWKPNRVVVLEEKDVLEEKKKYEEEIIETVCCSEHEKTEKSKI